MSVMGYRFFWATFLAGEIGLGLAGCSPETSGPVTPPSESVTKTVSLEASPLDASPVTVSKTLDAWKEAGAKIAENKDGTIKSIDFSAITEPAAFDPSEAGRFKTLRVLRGHGILSDKLAEQCAGAPELTELLWTETTATDKGLESFASLKKIKKLRLTGLTLTSRTTEILASFPALADLDLSASTLGNTDLAPLAKITNLTRLNLYQTSIDDAGIETLLPLAKGLSWLNLDATGVTDAIGPTLEHFENLTFLHLGRTKITDQMVESLAKLTKLEKIHVTRTGITEAGAATLRAKLPNTEVISVVEEKGQ